MSLLVDRYLGVVSSQSQKSDLYIFFRIEGLIIFALFWILELGDSNYTCGFAKFDFLVPKFK